jgi:UDP-N-acetylglucosamine 2-epimerase (non-hydrolysing)
MIKVLLVAGARPNFMKIAPLSAEMHDSEEFNVKIVHTGQHYDERMSDLFFRELGLPEPDFNLGVGSASQAVQTAEIMKRFEPVVLSEKPDWVIVVGDVNSTLACALVSTKLNVRVAHVEAGLRSNDRSMPEEINRVLTDAISDLLFVSEPSGLENLKREGIDESKIKFVGNVMIDTLNAHRKRADESEILKTLNLKPHNFAVITLHRPSNVDEPETFKGLIRAFEHIVQKMDVVWPIHPRAAKMMQENDLGSSLKQNPKILMTEPLGYLDFLKLMTEAAVVLTDSGGIQEETTILGVPCLTLRHNTERPVTIEKGTNTLVGNDPEAVIAAFDRCTVNPAPAGVIPDLWDGKAAQRIIQALLKN